MLQFDCQHYCGDEDCGKCGLYGYIFGCEGCEDYKDFFGNMPNKKKEDKKHD